MGCLERKNGAGTMNGLYICSFAEDETNAYYFDWLDGFRHAGFNCLNAHQCTAKSLLGALLFRKYDIIVIGYSCFYRLSGRIRQLLTAYASFSSATVVGFMQNEYRNFAQKIEFLEAFNLDILVTQLPQDIASEFYCGRTKAKILSLPHALNTRNVQQRNEHKDREIDVGSRLSEYPHYVGNIGRSETLPAFVDKVRNERNFIVDWETDRSKRLTHSDWFEFLRSCRVNPASESGTFFMQWNDKLRWQCNHAVEASPDLSFRQVYETYLRDSCAHLSGAMVSSRHYDAISAGTALVLVEGRYSDHFVPDEHYIELRANLSNYGEVVEKISDISFTQSVADKALTHALDSHTIDRRIQELIQAC